MGVSIRCITLVGFPIDREKLESVGGDLEEIFDHPMRLELRENASGKTGFISADSGDYFGFVVGHTTDENDGAMEMLSGGVADIMDLSRRKGEIWHLWQTLLVDLGIDLDFAEENRWYTFPTIQLHMTMLYN